MLRVFRAGEVHVVALIVRQRSVVGEIVDAAKGQSGTRMIALGGVVVDDIQDDLDARVVQILDHLLEFADRVARPAGVAGVAGLGRKESQRVVAPVIVEPLLVR